MDSAMNDDNEKNTSAKQNFDREAKTGHPSDDHPIIGGGPPDTHYWTSDNGARSSNKQDELTLRSATKAGLARGVPEPHNNGQFLGEGTTLADLRSHLKQLQAEIRDRNKRSADEEKNNAREVESANVDTASLTVSNDEMRDIVRKVSSQLKESKVKLGEPEHQYSKDIELLMRAFAQAEGDFQQRCRSVLSKYAEKSNSFFKYRAAWVWGWRRRLLQLVEEHVGASKSAGINRSISEIRLEIKQTLTELEWIQGIQRQDLLKAAGKKSRKVQSKRSELKSLPEDWKEQVIQAALRSPTYRLVVYVLATIGCRPVELRHGVEISLNEGHAEILVRKGAKVSEVSGQPWRMFKVPVASLPDDIREYLQDGGERVVLSVFSTDALRAFLREVSTKLGFKKVVTPYSFRHAVAEDLRREGVEAHEIAAALGQVAAQTSSMYGRRVRHHGGGRRPKKLAWNAADVVTPIPVKPLAQFDPKKMHAKGTGKKPGKNA